MAKIINQQVYLKLDGSELRCIRCFKNLFYKRAGYFRGTYYTTAVCSNCGTYSMYSMEGVYLPSLKDDINAELLAKKFRSEWELRIMRIESIWQTQTDEYI